MIFVEWGTFTAINLARAAEARSAEMRDRAGDI